MQVPAGCQHNWECTLAVATPRQFTVSRITRPTKPVPHKARIRAMTPNADLPRCRDDRSLPQRDDIPTGMNSALFTPPAMPIGSPRQRPAPLNS